MSKYLLFILSFMFIVLSVDGHNEGNKPSFENCILGCVRMYWIECYRNVTLYQWCVNACNRRI